jgi:hypothetical protein
MISDFSKVLTKRTVTETKSTTSSLPEISTVDSFFYGYIAVMNSYEVYVSMMQKVYATAKLFTKESFLALDKVIDHNGSFSALAGTVYEVVGTYNNFHKYYDIKKIL